MKMAIGLVAGSAVVYALAAACSVAVEGGAGVDAGSVRDAAAQVADGGASTPVSGSGSRLKARWLVGSDGSRLLDGWHDTRTGQRCDYITASDGERRCLPQYGGPERYSDPSCTTVLVSLPKTLPSNLRMVSVSTNARDSCRTASTYVAAIGKSFIGDLYALDGRGVCSPTGSAAGDCNFLFFLREGVVDPSDFVAAKTTVDP